MNRSVRCALVAGVVLAVCLAATAAQITVGPHKTCATIEQGLAKARSGDTVVVYPREGSKPYERVALRVDKSRITIRGVRDKFDRRVVLGGEGFEYTGKRSTPRAIVQFEPDADGGTLEGFELVGAHNAEGNGAGVRINGASDVTIRDCEIHACDMGIMSNGDGTAWSASNQRIEGCLIHANGTQVRPGQNHNLYLGGASAMVSHSEIASSLTGHNLKSRARLTLVRYCYIHDSANRELDLVDDRQTARRGSDAVLLGNVIAKDPNCPGNHSVIHFGQDGGGERNGTLWLIHNTIITPFLSPVAELSAPKARVQLINNIIWDGGGNGAGQQLVQLAGKREISNNNTVGGSHNWLSSNFALPSSANLETGYIAAAGEAPPFVDPQRGDFRLRSSDPHLVAAGLPWASIKSMLPTTAAEARLPAELEEYRWPLARQARPRSRADTESDLGAFGFDAKARWPKILPAENGPDSRPQGH